MTDEPADRSGLSTPLEASLSTSLEASLSPGILLFPFANVGGILFLLGGAALLSLCRAIPWVADGDVRTYLLFLAVVPVASYLYQIVAESVTGSRRPPKVIPDDWEDAWQDLFHMAGGCLVAFLPVAWLLLFAFIKQAGHLQQEWFQLLLGGCFFVGTLYYPMALLLNGFTQRFATAFNFGVGFRAIRTMGLDYVLCTLFFLVTHGAWILLEVFWVGSTNPGWNGPRLAAVAGTAFVGLYLSALQMRALGLLYRKHQERLGWSIGEGG